MHRIICSKNSSFSSWVQPGRILCSLSANSVEDLCEGIQNCCMWDAESNEHHQSSPSMWSFRFLKSGRSGTRNAVRSRNLRHQQKLTSTWYWGGPTWATCCRIVCLHRIQGISVDILSRGGANRNSNAGYLITLYVNALCWSPFLQRRERMRNNMDLKGRSWSMARLLEQTKGWVWVPSSNRGHVDLHLQILESEQDIEKRIKRQGKSTY